MNESESQRNFIEVLAEEFVARYRRGERPPVSEYTKQYPEHAEEIADLFPAMLMMENLRPSVEDESPSTKGVVPPFEQLGDYRIIREVGRGGMGVVYEAEQVSLGRHVALKVLSKELLSNPKQRQRFEREAKTAARLHHTNIVPVFGVGSENDHCYYVMQFIQGLSLDSVLAELIEMRLSGSASGALRSKFGTAGRQSASGQVQQSEASAADIAQSLLTGELRRAEAVGLSVDSLEATVDIPNELVSEAFGGTAGQFLSPRVPDSSARHGMSIHGARGDVTCQSSATSRLSGTFAHSSSSVVLPGTAGSGTAKASHRPTYWESIAEIGVQVGRALEYAHAQGVLHRDIKPANLVLDLKGTVWVTDFGLARLEDERDLTQTGDILGTLRYMAPESFKGQTDARSEIYSLGLTLYEMLAFRPAFDQRNRTALLDQVMHAHIEPLRRVNPEVPSDLEMIVHKAIERDPADRYQSAGELADDLQRFIDDEPIQARRASKRERLIRWSRHNKELSASLAAVVMLVSVLAVGSMIAAGYFRSVSGRLRETVGRLTQTQIELHDRVDALNAASVELQESRNEAQSRATENLQLAKLARDSEKREQELRRVAEDRANALQTTLYATEMNLAGQAAEEPGGLLRVGEITDKWNSDDSASDLRGWEWYYLDSLRHGERLSVSSSGAVCVAWSSDGKRFFGGDRDGVIRQYDAATGGLVQELFGHTGYVQDIALSPDGSKLASASRDMTIRIWDARTGQMISVLSGHTQFVYGVSWNPEGTMLASAASNQTGELFIWDVVTRQPIIKQAIRAAGAQVDWNPRLKLVATDSHVFDSETGTKLWDHSGWQTCWSPQGDRLAAVHDTAAILSARDGSTLVKLPGATGNHRAVHWHPSGTLLAIANDDNTVTIRETDSGTQVSVLRGHTDWVLDVRWSPDGSQLATAGNGTFKIWDWPVRRNPETISAGNGMVRSLVWNETGSALTAGGTIGVATCDVDQLTTQITIAPQQLGDMSQFTPGLAWHPETHRVAVRGKRVIALYDTDAWQPQMEIPEDADAELRSLDMSPDGTRLVTSAWRTSGVEKSILRVYSTATGQQQWVAELHPHLTGSVRWSPDGKRIACGGWGMAAILDGTSGKVLAEYPGGHELKWIHSIDWDPSGRRVALACMDRTIHIFESETGIEQCTLIGHTDSVLTVSWNPVGNRIASGGNDHTIRVWDVHTGHQLLTLRGENQDVSAVAWSPDGLRLASGTGDGQIRIWDAQPGYAQAGSVMVLARINRRLELNPDSIGDLKLRLRIHQQIGDVAASELDRQQIRRVYEEQWNADPTNEVVANELASILLATRPQQHWTILTPTQMSSSQGGATLTRLDDGSVLATGNDILGDAYTVDVRCDLDSLAAIRLEVLPDRGLPNDGPGRHATGNFQLAKFRAYLIQEKKETSDTAVSGSHREVPAEPQRLSFSRVIASFAYQSGDADVSGTIRDGLGPVWHIWGQTGRAQHADFLLEQAVELKHGETLRLELFHASTGDVINLGRFRLWARSAGSSLLAEQVHTAIEKRAFSGMSLLAAVLLSVGDLEHALQVLDSQPDDPSTDIIRHLLGAIAHHELRHATESRASAEQLAQQLRDHTVHTDLQPLLTEVLSSIGGMDSSRIEDLLAQSAITPEFTRLTAEAESQPTSLEICFRRGELLARMGRWRDCADNNLRMTQIEPARRFSWSCTASPLLLANDHDGYRKLCLAMAEQFKDTTEADVADTVCKISLLLPDTIPLSELPIETLRSGATDPKWEHFRDWFEACCALIAYREGTFEFAVEWTNRLDSLTSQPGTLALLVRAMAEQKLGQHDGALRSLAQAESQIPSELRTLGTPQYTGPLPVPEEIVAHDWLIPEILRREAADLILQDLDQQ